MKCLSLQKIIPSFTEKVNHAKRKALSPYLRDKTISITVSLQVCWQTMSICLLSASPLCRIELILPLLAPRTFPVVRQIFKSCAVVLIGVIDISADRADIFSCCLLLREIHLCKNGRHRVIQIYYSCIPFEDSLSEEQIDVFHKILDCVSNTAAAEMSTAYKVGFKDSVALMIEVQI